MNPAAQSGAFVFKAGLAARRSGLACESLVDLKYMHASIESWINEGGAGGDDNSMCQPVGFEPTRAAPE